MNNNVDITIIVPVYNVYDYLNRCVESILAQDFKSYKVLLIDDGSTDGSGKICDEISELHSSFITLHKSNGGLGSARNYGLQYVDTQFVCFVDSDDKMQANYLRCMYEAIIGAEADICIAGYTYSSGKYTSIIKSVNEELDATDLLNRFANGNSIYNFVWNKLYKTDIIKRMQTWFSDRHCAEDMLFNSLYYRYVNKAVVISDSVYTYYVNLKSLSNSRRSSFIEDMVIVEKTYRETRNVLFKNELYADNLDVVLIRSSLSNFFNVNRVSIGDLKEYIQKCKYCFKFDFLKPSLEQLCFIDRLIFRSLKHNRFYFIKLLISANKMIKTKLFPLFCIFRNFLHK